MSPKEVDKALFECRYNEDLDSCYALGDVDSRQTAAFGLSRACTSGHRDGCARLMDHELRFDDPLGAVIAGILGCERGQRELCVRVLDLESRFPDAVGPSKADVQQLLAEIDGKAPAEP